MSCYDVALRFCFTHCFQLLFNHLCLLDCSHIGERPCLPCMEFVYTIDLNFGVSSTAVSMQIIFPQEMQMFFVVSVLPRVSTSRLCMISTHIDFEKSLSWHQLFWKAHMAFDEGNTEVTSWSPTGRISTALCGSYWQCNRAMHDTR